MKNLIRLIARALVDNPEQVLVVDVEEDQTMALALRLAKHDLGKVIGNR